MKPNYQKLISVENGVAIAETNHNIVLDQANQLMWTESNLIGGTDDDDDAEQHTHATGQTAIDALNAESFAGFNDWRYPTVDELQTILDRTKFSPAIDKDAFPNTRSDWYWTSLPLAALPDVYAWIVDFDYGHVGDGYHLRNNTACVRAVRSVSPSQ